MKKKIESSTISSVKSLTEPTELINALLNYDKSYLDIALFQLLVNKKIDFNHISNLYVKYLEENKEKAKCREIQSNVIIHQLLDKKLRKKDYVIKKGIYYYNNTPNNNLPRHINDKKYNYTEKDDNEQSNIFESLYGFNLKEN